MTAFTGRLRRGRRGRPFNVQVDCTRGALRIRDAATGRTVQTLLLERNSGIEAALAMLSVQPAAALAAHPELRRLARMVLSVPLPEEDAE